jgi:hypothetical protein
MGYSPERKSQACASGNFRGLLRGCCEGSLGAVSRMHDATHLERYYGKREERTVGTTEPLPRIHENQSDSLAMTARNTTVYHDKIRLVDFDNRIP